MPVATAVFAGSSRPRFHFVQPARGALADGDRRRARDRNPPRARRPTLTPLSAVSPSLVTSIVKVTVVAADDRLRVGRLRHRDAADGMTVTASDTADVTVVQSAHLGGEDAGHADRRQRLRTATFTIEVTNDGDTPLSERQGRRRARVGLRSRARRACRGEHTSYQCTKANVAASFTNTAVAKGTPPVGDDVTASDTADVTVVHPHISVAKTPDTQTVVSGSTATFTIEVTNDGDTALSNVEVDDALASDCDHAIGALAVGRPCLLPVHEVRTWPRASRTPRSPRAPRRWAMTSRRAIPPT